MIRGIFSLAVVISIVFSSCSKDSGSSTPADTAAVIDLTAPTAGTIFLNGSSIGVDGTVIDNNVLSTVSVTIKNKNTSAILYSSTTSTGANTFYRFHWAWTVTGISSTTPASLTITSKDKYNYESTRSIDFVLDN
jgi:hypothetical protein